MKSLEMTGKTVQEAIDAAVEQLGVNISEVTYDILEEGSKGFMGLGSKPAKVLVTLNQPEPIILARTFLYKMFKAMNIDVDMDIDLTEDNVLNINLNCKDMGIIIGKRGQTLDSIQYLVSIVVNKSEGDYVRVVLDTEGYREKRKKTLEMLANNLAKKAGFTKRNVSLEPMNPFERRIIHSALQGNNFVTTYSEGEEPYRYVVIAPKRQNRYYQ